MITLRRGDAQRCPQNCHCLGLIRTEANCIHIVVASHQSMHQRGRLSIPNPEATNVDILALQTSVVLAVWFV